MSHKRSSGRKEGMARVSSPPRIRDLLIRQSWRFDSFRIAAPRGDEASLLFSDLKAVCATFSDPRKGRGGDIEVADFGLSAFAMFFMQSAYRETLEKGHGRSN